MADDDQLRIFVLISGGRRPTGWGCPPTSSKAHVAMTRRASSISNDGDARDTTLTCDLVSLALHGAHIPGPQHPTLAFRRCALEVMTVIAVIVAIVAIVALT
jgi:hypothetical protein